MKPTDTLSEEPQSTFSEFELSGDVHERCRTGFQSRKLIARGRPLHEWLEARYQHRLDPYAKYTTGPISTETTATDRKGRQLTGVNFASQDYLGLSTHQSVSKAVTGAISKYGVHSAGSAALMGNTALSRELEQTIADYLKFDDVTLFPTGWGAGFGIIRGLVSPRDHVVIDSLAHACLHEGARLSTPNVHKYRHNDTSHALELAAEAQSKSPDAGILVVTETLFSMDADSPNIKQLQDGCRAIDATLLVDVAHDLGNFGPNGLGVLEEQNLVGDVDIVIGSLSKTFATNGGFIATDEPSLKPLIRFAVGPSTFSNALSPLQSAAALAAFEVVRSEEGAHLRSALLDRALQMRTGLSELGLEIMGRPSALIPVVIGPEGYSRLVTRHLLESGALVNMVEYPAVARGASRIRLQLMAKHTEQQVDRFVALVDEAMHEARRVSGDLGIPTS